MDQIKKLLKEREDYLCQIKKEKERALQSVPEGSLRICSRDKKVHYYQRNNPKDFNGTYIREKDAELARQLAQKDYDWKVLRSIEKELEAIKKYTLECPAVSAEEIYEKMRRERQRLIHPIRETEEQYIARWQSIVYQGKEIGEDTPEIYTSKGERVRSKSEVIIADILHTEGIPYRYECPLQLRGGRIFHPDFTVLNVKKRKEIYWEHLGMMDDGNYVENALQKIALYEQNSIVAGDNLILTYETKKIPINPQMVRLKIEQYLK